MKKGFLVFILLIASAGVSHAAVVYLKDGGQVSGTVVSATAQDLQLHTPDGMLTIRADRILRVDYASDTPQAPKAPQISPPSDDAPPAPRPERRARWTRDEDADEPSNRFFSLGLGFAAPLSRVNFASAGGGSDDNGDTGLYLGAQYGQQIASRLAAGFNIEYLGRSGIGSQSLVPEAETDISGNTLLLLATLKYSLSTHGPVRPYLLGGVGANRTSTVIEATPNPGFGWSDTATGETRTLVDDSHWGLASTLRLGLDFMLSDPGFFSLEFGWNGLSNPAAQATAAGRNLGLDSVTGNLTALTFAARWGWRF